MIEIVPVADVPADAVEALLDRAFEPGRHARTAYRLRVGTAPLPRLSFAALDRATDPAAGGALAGSIQCWPVRLVAESGEAWPLAMIGPVAVAPERQLQGIGRMLMAATLAAAHASGEDAGLVLIGDPGYYGRFFGFTAERTGGWALPGPFEPRRLLARGPAVPEVRGTLEPRPD